MLHNRSLQARRFVDCDYLWFSWLSQCNLRLKRPHPEGHPFFLSRIGLTQVSSACPVETSRCTIYHLVALLLLDSSSESEPGSYSSFSLQERLPSYIESKEEDSLSASCIVNLIIQVFFPFYQIIAAFSTPRPSETLFVSSLYALWIVRTSV